MGTYIAYNTICSLKVIHLPKSYGCAIFLSYPHYPQALWII